MSDNGFHLVPPKDNAIEWIKRSDDDPNFLIGCGIILDHATRTVLIRNGDGSEVLIPADLLPEDLTTATGDLDALRVVKHLVELIRKHEQEQKDLWQYIKRLMMQAEAEKRTINCLMLENGCRNFPAISHCPFKGLSCGQVTPEHWLEILRKGTPEFIIPLKYFKSFLRSEQEEEADA